MAERSLLMNTDIPVEHRLAIEEALHRQDMQDPDYREYYKRTVQVLHQRQGKEVYR